jgi:hypothetical protein
MRRSTIRRFWRAVATAALVTTALPPSWGNPAVGQSSRVETVQSKEASQLEVIAVRELPESVGIELVFSKQSAEVLRRLSLEAAGHEVDFFLNGRKLARLKLRDPITGDGIMLSGPFTDEFKALFRGKEQKYVDIKFN